MTRNPQHIPVGGTATVRVVSRSGRVGVVAEDRADILVEWGEVDIDLTRTIRRS